jgi:hypothetical protein
MSTKWENNTVYNRKIKRLSSDKKPGKREN